VKRHLVILFLLLSLAACDKPLTIEQQVIFTIREMEARIEDGERRAFMEFIAEDFTAREGRMNRDQVRAMVVFQLNRYERLQAQLFPIAVIETGEGTAEANFRALVTGGPNWIPDSGQVYDFETSWRQDGSDWTLVSADWEPVPLDEVIDKLPLPASDP